MEMAKDQLLDFDIKTGKHRSPVEEWVIHKTMSPRSFEWHYITCPMEGANGHTYFFFLTLFNFSAKAYIEKEFLPIFPDLKLKDDQFVYTLCTHLCDYDTDLFLTDMELAFPTLDDLFDFKTNSMTFKSGYDVNWRYDGKNVELKSKGRLYEIDLHMTGGDRVVWAKDHLGIEGFIQEGAPEDRSFYYSLPKLPFQGTVKYPEKDGTWVTTDVYGHGWIDRQWGDYMTNTWEWFSFRFANGDRINLYNFAGGHQVGSFQKEDGTIEYFDKFKVIQNGYTKADPPHNTWFSWGWSFELPVGDKRYTTEPLSRKNIILAPGNALFEGLAKLLDHSGKQVGWAVCESLDVRRMQNGPYQEFQNF
jgi:hypothetical protein